MLPVVSDYAGAERVRKADPPRVQAALAVLATLHLARLEDNDQLARRVTVAQLDQGPLVEHGEAAAQHEHVLPRALLLVHREHGLARHGVDTELRGAAIVKDARDDHLEKHILRRRIAARARSEVRVHLQLLTTNEAKLAREAVVVDVVVVHGELLHLRHAVVPADVEVRHAALVGAAAAREHLGPLAPADAVEPVLKQVERRGQ
eukprot:scaffold102750_cov75-Phaeocystis_antarctica.AAC.2